jgi:hypothetical protein
MSGVKDKKKAHRPAAFRKANTRRGGFRLGVGKTLAKRRNANGISDAAPKARCPQKAPQPASWYVSAKVLLRVQTATESENMAK